MHVAQHSRILSSVCEVSLYHCAGDGVNKVYIAQSTAKSTILERINVESLLKSYKVYAPWQEFSMHELRDYQAIPLKYARSYALGCKIHFLNMNLGQWIRSRSEDGPFVQYEIAPVDRHTHFENQCLLLRLFPPMFLLLLQQLSVSWSYLCS